jgi:penicillin-binding protein 1A
VATRRHSPAARIVLRAGSLLVIALLVLGTISVAVGSVAAKVSSTVQRYTDISIPKIPVGPQTTFVYDRNGKLMTTLHAEVNRTLVPMSQISPNLQHAVVAIEDKDFYHHGAISASSIFRAAYANVVSGKIEQGGSTITQQFVKNVFTGDERTLSRKVHEAVLAVKLEHQYSKSQILEKYLNTVYFGHGAYGAQAAAETYFGIPASKLTVLQSALLAGMVAAPGAFDPVANRKESTDRRNEVLTVMGQQGYITPTLATKLSSKGIKVPGLKHPDQSPYPYYMQYVTQYLLDHRGYDQTFEGGLRVTTTLDQTDQQAAQQAVAAHLPNPMDPDAALVAIDPSSGAIRAMVGGRNFAKHKFNLAWQAHRQAGSAFKTFTLTAAMEQGISLQSVWNGPPQLTIDDPRCFDPVKQKPWDVANYADESAGTMPLVDAIANSVNTIFAQLVTTVGPGKVASVAHQMGIRSKLEPVCSITLGSQAVTPLDMADAYATLASGGIHHAPYPVTKIASAGGKVLDRSSTTGHRAIGSNVAALVSYALQGVVQHGTGTAANIGRPVAGKTGTGQDYRDAWFCGYTPQLAACVWVGYRKGEISMHNIEGFPDVFGGSIPAEIWHDFMSTALAGQPVQDFPAPDFSHNTKFPAGTVTLPPPAPSPTTAPHHTPSPQPTHTHHSHSPHAPSPSPSDGNGTGAATGAGGAAGAAIVAVLVGLAGVRIRGGRHRRRRGRTR